VTGAPLQEDGVPLSITCPHCKKTFAGQLIDGGAERYRGYKCPHCKLFVPAERTEAERDTSS
jgi:DNA-directed RNA polymerase subunit RPC12/RpoP